jgi:hypothetical protein
MKRFHHTLLPVSNGKIFGNSDSHNTSFQAQQGASVKRTELGSVNEGIQGNVQADVLAVGKNAKAIKRIQQTDYSEIESAVADLQGSIHKLSLPPAVKEAVLKDVDSLKVESKSKQPNRDRIANILAGLSEKVKLAGVVLTEGAGLAESIKKIAEMAQVSLKAIGIGL